MGIDLARPCYCRWRYLRIYTRTPRLQALARRRDVYPGVGADTGEVGYLVNLERALTCVNISLARLKRTPDKLGFCRIGVAQNESVVRH